MSDLVARALDMVVVAVAIAPLNAEPRADSEQLSQRLAGHLLLIVEDRSPWLRVRGDDDYEGWVHRGYVRPIATDADQAASRSRISLGSVVRGANGIARALPLGAALDDDATLLAGEAIEASRLAERFPREANAVVQTAVDLFAGTPYQWGGITPWGADCSGLVQSCFGLHGIRLPRDASQQALRGHGVDGGHESLAAADLLFFADREGGRITHVAIAAAERRIVHLAIGRGGYALERLDDTRDPYTADLVSRYRFTRRIPL